MQVHHSRRRQNESRQQTERPLSEQERIDRALALMVTRIGHSMSPERINQWHQDLGGYSIEAIEWAIDTYGRMARRLPALADLVELLNTWQADEIPAAGCEPECQARHGKGYHLNDVLWLFKKRLASGEKEWSPAQWEKAMDELDAARGHKPEWRQ